MSQLILLSLGIFGFLVFFDNETGQKTSVWFGMIAASFFIFVFWHDSTLESRKAKAQLKLAKEEAERAQQRAEVERKREQREKAERETLENERYPKFKEDISKHLSNKLVNELQLNLDTKLIYENSLNYLDLVPKNVFNNLVFNAKSLEHILYSSIMHFSHKESYINVFDSIKNDMKWLKDVYEYFNDLPTSFDISHFYYDDVVSSTENRYFQLYESRHELSTYKNGLEKYFNEKLAQEKDIEVFGRNIFTYVLVTELLNLCNECISLINDKIRYTEHNDFNFVKCFYELGLEDLGTNLLSISFFSKAQHGWIVNGSKGQVNKKELLEKLPVLEDALNMPIIVSNIKQGLLLQKQEVLDERITFPDYVNIDKSLLESNTLSYGLSVDGTPHGRAISEDKHLLIVGSSGSGKSVLQQFIIEQLYSNLGEIEHLYLVDLKGGVEFFEHLEKDKTTVVEDIDTLCEIIDSVVNIVMGRFEQLKETKKKSYEDGKKIYLIIDEFAQISYWKPEQSKSRVKSKLISDLNKLSTLGRAAGVRLICGLQKCTTSEMDSAFKNNLQDRILMKNNNPKAFEEVFGYPSFDEIDIPKGSALKVGEMLYLADGYEYPAYIKCPYEES